MSPKVIKWNYAQDYIKLSLPAGRFFLFVFLKLFCILNGHIYKNKQLMIIGNQEAKNRLQKYLEQHAAAVSGQASFFLLYGPANIGKSAIALELAQSYL